MDLCEQTVKLCSPCRFRMLAEEFQSMYRNLKVETEEELKQLKVRTGYCVEPYHNVLTHLFGLL